MDTDQLIMNHVAEYKLTKPEWVRQMRRMYLSKKYKGMFLRKYRKSVRYVADCILQYRYYTEMEEPVFDYKRKFYREEIQRFIRRMRKDRNYAIDIQRAREYPFKFLIKFNRHNMAICPFHDDHIPSLQYYPDTNSVYCFSCHKKYSTIDFVMHVEGKTFPEAVRSLQ